ncbi:dihydroorotate dehydrogenase-like protein [bacterium]|nr:dihydroorotate dehydrogenase-like protein [bacterium]
MTDLTTTYMGKTIPSPVIVGSSGLTYSVKQLKVWQDAGAGACVLKSVFEEQILIEADHDLNEVHFHPEGADYFDVYVKEHHLSHYLDLVRDAKKEIEIPVIASINCVSASQWTEFAQRLEKAGADGLELNYFMMPSDPKMQEGINERTLFQIVRKILNEVKIPVSVKVSSYFSNLANTLDYLSRTGIAALVLFNRFYQPDIDIEKVDVKPASPFTTHRDITETLRWIALASEFAECDLCASTGVHDGEGVVKQILAGANAVQMVSAIYHDKAAALENTVRFTGEWMEEHKFATIDDFRGKLSRSGIKNPAFYERVQFMKHFGGR